MRFACTMFLLAGGLVAACGSDDGSDGSAGPLSAEAAAFVKDFCALTAPCCTTVEGGEGTCLSETDTFGRGRKFDGSKVEACLDALRAEASGKSFCGRAPDTLACAVVFKSASAKAPGQPCKTAIECANTDGGDGLCIGVGSSARCRATKRGTEGDACLGTRAAGVTSAVTTPAESAAALCYVADGLHCDASTKTCQKRGVIGATCSPSEHACVEAGWCATTTEECTGRTAANQPCESSDECALGHTCSSDGSGNAVCIALAKEGEDCVRGDECDPAESLVCDSGTSKCIADVGAAEASCSGKAALAR